LWSITVKFFITLDLATHPKLNISHKLHEKKMKSEQAVLPNPCLEEEEDPEL
jgi:hypothetical protein